MIIRQKVGTSPVVYQLVNVQYNHNTRDKVSETIILEDPSYEKLDEIRSRYEDVVLFGENKDITDIYKMLFNPIADY